MKAKIIRKWKFEELDVRIVDMYNGKFNMEVYKYIDDNYVELNEIFDEIFRISNISNYNKTLEITVEADTIKECLCKIDTQIEQIEKLARKLHKKLHL